MGEWGMKNPGQLIRGGEASSTLIFYTEPTRTEMYWTKRN